jgi:imidazole glycerol-phosphate synthase subunit HisH
VACETRGIPMGNKAICILDYGSGNVSSVYNVLRYLDYDVTISNRSEDIKNSSHIILPGVGAFGAAMDKIMREIPFDVLEDEVLGCGKPFLGICVGMQVLADRGVEFGDHKGFGWLSGVVDRIDPKDHPLPHIGWNEVILRREAPLFTKVGDHRDFYFVHSYALFADSEDDVLGETEYGGTFISAVCKDNIHGVQFHPEKSQRAGQLLLTNFCNMGDCETS